MWSNERRQKRIGKINQFSQTLKTFGRSLSFADSGWKQWQQLNYYFSSLPLYQIDNRKITLPTIDFILVIKVDGVYFGTSTLFPKTLLKTVKFIFFKTNRLLYSIDKIKAGKLLLHRGTKMKKILIRRSR